MSHNDDMAAGAAVLIVDDDPVLQLLFSRVLEMAGFEAIVVSDGESALRVLNDRPIAVVLLDGRMPGMSGADVVRSMRASPDTALVPVVMVTGAAEVADRVEGLEAGADDYLVKPVEVDELVARVRAQLRSRLAWGAVAERNLQHRIEAVHKLSQISPSDSPEILAQQICAVLQQVEGFKGALLYHLAAPGVALPLAGFGLPAQEFPVGVRLPLSVAREIEERTRLGPAIASASKVGQDTVSVLVAFGPTERRVGALSLHLRARGSDDVSGYLGLSTAVDIAGMVTGLLAPVLARSAELADSVARLEGILARGELGVALQPVVSLGENNVVGYEALARLADGTPPDVFLAEAAHMGMSKRVEREMLRAAIAAGATLPPNTWLSCNVSAAFAMSEGKTLDDILVTSGRQLVVELTEHEPIEDYAALREMLASLQTRVSIAVDDAGAGYASLRHVLELEPSFVKLDREWVHGIEHDRAKQALVSGLVSFARDTECLLIAEGVETMAELEVLVRLGIPLGQGFLLGQPKVPN